MNALHGLPQPMQLCNFGLGIAAATYYSLSMLGHQQYPLV